MKINRLLLKEGVKTIVEEEIDFSSFTFDANHVKRIPKCNVLATVTDFENLLVCELNINADVVASCAYTLEDVPLKKNIKEILYFTDDPEDPNEEAYYEPNNEIVLDQYVYSFIIASVPHNVHKKGAKLPESGSGYRVISEEQYEEERKGKKESSPFDILDNLDL